MPFLKKPCNVHQQFAELVYRALTSKGERLLKDHSYSYKDICNYTRYLWNIHITSTTWTVKFVLTLELPILFLSTKFKVNLTFKVVHFPSNLKQLKSMTCLTLKFCVQYYVVENSFSFSNQTNEINLNLTFLLYYNVAVENPIIKGI